MSLRITPFLLLPLQVKGGSGNYQWSVSNTSIALINKKGLISTQNKIGKSQVKVADSKNPTFFDEGTVTVLPPEELNFVSEHLEVELGKVIKLPLSVLAYLDEGLIYICLIDMESDG